MGLLTLLLVLGYFHAREQILAITKAQLNQFSSSITRQDDYTRQWIMRTLPTLAQLISDANLSSSSDLAGLKKQITSAIVDDRGKQSIEISLILNGSVHTEYYDSSGTLALKEARKIFNKPYTKSEIEHMDKAIWAPPYISLNRTMHMRYTMPLKNEHGHTLGTITTSLALPWFFNRIRAFSIFKQCIPFFLTEEGQWTLPQAADTGLDFLKKEILQYARGITSVRWQEKSYIAVFLPSAEKHLFIGVLIPREDIFGTLDTITTTLVTAGLIILALAAFGLYRTCNTFLRPIVQLMGVADKLAHGKLIPPLEATSLTVDKVTLETEQLQNATNSLRIALHQRIRDLTVMAQTHERLTGELAFARTIQNSLRPNQLPHIPHVPMAAYVYEAREVCGDMYDCFKISENKICCVIGNVAEHGVPAALLTNRIMPCLHELILSGLSPSKALEHVNHVFETDNRKGGIFISALVGVLHTDTGLFCWASAGQIPPFALKDTTAWQLPWSENVPLGIRSHENYEEKTLQLQTGQTLLFVPQRVLSVLNPHGEAYGEKKLHAFLHEHTFLPQQLLQSLIKDINTHAQSQIIDDIVLFAMQWNEERVATSYAPTSHASLHG